MQQQDFVSLILERKNWCSAYTLMALLRNCECLQLDQYLWMIDPSVLKCKLAAFPLFLNCILRHFEAKQKEIPVRLCFTVEKDVYSQSVCWKASSLMIYFLY